jgi:hypothetical protein
MQFITRLRNTISTKLYAVDRGKFLNKYSYVLIPKMCRNFGKIAGKLKNS